jgi:hypothetical protein
MYWIEKRVIIIITAVPLHNDGRIVNGTDVPPGKYPAQVYLSSN